MKFNKMQTWGLRQLLGVETAAEIIAFVEGGYLQAVRALQRGDIEDFLACLPVAVALRIRKALGEWVAKRR